MKNNYLGMALSALVGALLVFAFAGGDVPMGASGSNYTNLLSFKGGFVEGGGVVATSSNGGTMETSWIKDFNQIDVTVVGGAAVNLTTPTHNQLSSFLENVGDTKTIYLRNLTADAATTTTIVAGTGIDLRMGEETGADVIINGLNNALLTFKRVSSATTSVIVNEDVVGD